jgi:predicted dehydrogenase
MAQYGTQHPHGLGKLAVLLDSPEVELAGVYEPDAAIRRELATRPEYAGVRWYAHQEELLSDAGIVAVAVEGRNAVSLGQATEVLRAGKHLWYDKPAGEDWPAWQAAIALAHKRGLYVQMGYMFRYHHGFRRIGDMARSGLLGRIYKIRAHMSTDVPDEARRVLRVHRGGMFYDLAGHMLDQIVWLLDRPEAVTTFFHNDSDGLPDFEDNNLAVLEYPLALAMVEVSAMEARPMARRFEVYGTRGSAILMEPFEPASQIRLCLREASGDYAAGLQWVPVQSQPRQALYALELAAFVGVLGSVRAPDRTPEHELLVQETLLRCTGAI